MYPTCIRATITLVALAVLTMTPLRHGIAAQGTDAPPYAVPVATLAQAVRNGRVPKDTAAILARRGSVPVIVRLQLPMAWQPEHLLTATQVELQRVAIRNAQQAVLDKLGAAGVENVKRYAYIPHLAIRATEMALTLLVRMPEIYVVRSDIVSEPTLANTAVQIGADDVVNALAPANAGSGQAIAILDSGVDKNHPFFGGRVVSEACYSTEDSDTESLCPGGAEISTSVGSAVCTDASCDHGTHVAGIAAGNAASDGFTGVAPAASLIAIQVFHSLTDPSGCFPDAAPCNRSFTSDWLLGVERVYHLATTSSLNVAAINLSLGAVRYTDQTACDADGQAALDAFGLLWGAEIAPVVASGNAAQVMLLTGVTAFRPGIAFPACVSTAISVGSVDNVNAVSGFSQTAPFLQLLAPGINVNSAVPGGFDTKSGTSMAAPHVAGAFAVLKALDPWQSVDERLERLKNTGLSVSDARMTPALVTSRISVDNAVESQMGVPLRPDRLVITNVAGSSVSAQWRDNSTTETRFRLTATPTGALLLPVRQGFGLQNQTSATVSGLTPNQTYQITVRACNAADQCSAHSAPPIAIKTKNTLPSIPTNLREGTVTTTSIVVAWNSSSIHPVTSFRLRSTANASRTWVTQTLPASALSHTFTNLTPSTGYNFVLQACNTDGCSADTPILTVVTRSAGTPPAAPTNLHVCGVGVIEACMAGRVDLLWRDRSNNEDRFDFEWHTAQAGVPPSQAAWNVIALPANSQRRSFTTLPAGQLHYFRVRACNVGGCSAYSNMVSYTVP